MVRSYPKVYNLGHPALIGFLEHRVLVEEKIDGSQFSFSRTEGGVEFRSNGAQINPDAPHMFRLGVESVQAIASTLTVGWIYRAEFLQKPKHNVLCYDRIPTRNVILFDIEREDGTFLSSTEKHLETDRVGLECVPELWCGELQERSLLDELLNTKSVLGSIQVEGVILKPVGYKLYGADGKVLMGKYVSEKFKEIHRKEWKTGDHASRGNKLDMLLDSYRSVARWDKAVQHLKEAGTLLSEPKDIGALLIEIQKDIADECGDEIRHELWKIVKHDLMRRVIKGFPEWYKEELLGKQFEGGVSHGVGGSISE